jgi:hydroxypyruvate isomerase
MTPMTRRQAILIGGASALTATQVAPAAAQAADARGVVKSGRLKQSVARWCYQKIPLADFCKGVAALGLSAMDLLREEEWAVARDHGLACSMGWGQASTIPDGFNDKANHDRLVREFERLIPSAAKQGVPNLIAFFGNRRGMSDGEAIDNCVAGLTRVKPIAEAHSVTVCVELLNSKVNHKDYHGDRTAFGVAVMKGVGSPRVKLLYDIYHMQIMEGDILRTIQDNREWIAHYHTGGVPGRHELDETQELQWRTIARALVDAGFAGHFAHEFIPVRDPLTSLREAVVLCDV